MTKRFRSEPLTLPALQAVGRLRHDEQATVGDPLAAVAADAVATFLDTPQSFRQLHLSRMCPVGERGCETTVAAKTGCDAQSCALRRDDRIRFRLTRERPLDARQLTADVRFKRNCALEIAPVDLIILSCL